MYLSTKLPFKSNDIYLLSLEVRIDVFYIIITSKLLYNSVLIENNPYILAIKESPFLIWSIYSSIIFKIKTVSYFFNVLIKNLLSFEKKKKLPLFPDPSPALNIISLFLLISRDSNIIYALIPSNYYIILNLS